MSDNKTEEQNEILSYERKTFFAKLQDFCHIAEKDSFIELTEWKNGEGFDVNIHNYGEKFIQLSWGEFKLIKKLAKKLYNFNDF